jgi:hypothetical protein
LRSTGAPCTMVPFRWRCRVSVFLCRWPNGDFSIVQAHSRDEAIERLDELGNADQAILKRMAACMFHFGLDDRGEIVLKETGAETEEIIAKECYPELEAVFAAADDDETPEERERKIREAVELERIRLADRHPTRKSPKTEIGRRLQEQTGMPSSLVDRHVERAAKEMLEKDVERGLKKPN